MEIEERRYFAALILAGMSAENPTSQISANTLAEYAVKRADALIAELNKEQSDAAGA